MKKSKRVPYIPVSGVSADALDSCLLLNMTPVSLNTSLKSNLRLMNKAGIHAEEVRKKVIPVRDLIRKTAPCLETEYDFYNMLASSWTSTLYDIYRGKLQDRGNVDETLERAYASVEEGDSPYYNIINYFRFTKKADYVGQIPVLFAKYAQELYEGAGIRWPDAELIEPDDTVGKETVGKETKAATNPSKDRSQEFDQLEKKLAKLEKDSIRQQKARLALEAKLALMQKEKNQLIAKVKESGVLLEKAEEEKRKLSLQFQQCEQDNRQSAKELDRKLKTAWTKEKDTILKEHAKAAVGLSQQIQELTVELEEAYRQIEQRIAESKGEPEALSVPVDENSFSLDDLLSFKPNGQ